MKDECIRQIKNISRMSRVIIFFLQLSRCVTIIALLFAWAMLFSLSPESGIKQFSIGDTDYSKEEILLLIDGKREFLAILLAMWAAFWFYLLGLAVNLFKCFRDRALFTDKTIFYTRMIASLYTAHYVLAFVALFLVTTKNITLNFSIDGLVTIGVMWLFVWMLQVGRALKIDSDMAI